MFDRSSFRREFLKAAITVGGVAALSTCLSRAPDDPVLAGTGAFEALPSRQHAWNELYREDSHGNVEVSRHQVLLYLDLDDEEPPDEAARATVEDALRVLDRIYEWNHKGVIWSVVYSPRYFDHFDNPLSDGVDLPESRALSPSETPDSNRQDVLVHLVSNRVDAVLEAEQAFLGKADEVNGVVVGADLSSVFSVVSRRTGFVKAGPSAKHQFDLSGIPDGNPIPEVSPLLTGFKASFVESQATEEYVTIDDGPSAGAATKHVANVR